MATQELPVRSDLPQHEFQIDLEGTIFTITIRFNERKARWVMDIGDSNGTSILAGIVLLTDVNITDQYVGDNLPPGRFFVVDETGEGKNPGINDLGNDVKLFYLEANNG